MKKQLIAKAVEPLKNRALQKTEEAVLNFFTFVKTELENSNWDITVAAPYPKFKDCWDSSYKLKIARHKLFTRLTKSALISETVLCVDLNKHPIVVWDEEAAARYLHIAKEDSILHYDRYVEKLNKKIDSVKSAELIFEDGVWNSSLLKITKEDDSIEIWKTTMIINHSSLGKSFNQWPTRKMKC